MNLHEFLISHHILVSVSFFFIFTAKTIVIDRNDTVLIVGFVFRLCLIFGSRFLVLNLIKLASRNIKILLHDVVSQLTDKTNAVDVVIEIQLLANPDLTFSIIALAVQVSIVVIG